MIKYLLFLILFSTQALSAPIIKVDYLGFTVWLDCDKRGAIKFQYKATKDKGNVKRSDNFYLDKNVASECQQSSNKAYGNGFDRGHLVPANHLDDNEIAIKASNTMTNIVPQVSQMNRGAWYQTELITECYRDINDLLIIGGVIYSNEILATHSIKLPDKFWKVIITGKNQDERGIAWIIPNSKDATRKNLDNYLVSIKDIEKLTNETIPIAAYAKDIKLKNSWVLPIGCDKK